MKGAFRVVWHQGKHMVYIGEGAEDDMAELVIEIEEVSPDSLKVLSDSLSQFQVDWL